MDWIEMSMLLYSEPAFFETELRRAGLEPAGPPRDGARQQPLDHVIDHAPVFYAVHLWNLYEESLGRAAA